MLRALLCTLLLLALTPVAAAAPFTAQLTEGDLTAVGDVRVEAIHGVLDLSDLPLAGFPALRFERATGGLMEREWAGYFLAGRLIFEEERARMNHTWELGAGAIRIGSCDSCDVVLAAGGGDAIRARASQASVAALPSDVEWRSGVPDAEAEATYYRRAAAGEPVVSAPDGLGVELPPRILLFIDNAEGEVIDAEGARSFWTGTRTTTTGAATGTTRDRWLVLMLEGARLDVPVRAPLHAERVLLGVRGETSWDDASGWLRIGGERRELDGDDVVATGQLDAEVIPAAPALLSRSSAPRSEAAGQAEAVWIAGARVGAPVQAAAKPAAAGAAALAILVLLLFYTRLRQEEILLHPNRRRIYEAVAREPGIAVAALARAVGLAEGVVRHHVATLERRRLVATRRSEGTRAVFAVEALPRAAWIPPPKGARLRVKEALAGAPGATQTEIASRTRLSPRLVSYHLARMRARGEVTVEPGRPARYRAP